MAYVVVNKEPFSSWQAQTDTFLRNNNVSICGNDYIANNVDVHTVRNLFAPPTASNPDPRPVFVAINCLTNSPSHAYRQVVVRDFYAGGGSRDFSAQIAGFRNAIDAVQAPPPRLSALKRTGDTVEFTIPGQRGRTNRVESTTNFVNWTTVTNVFGTNAPVVIRDSGVTQRPNRAYRVVRP